MFIRTTFAAADPASMMSSTAIAACDAHDEFIFTGETCMEVTACHRDVVGKAGVDDGATDHLAAIGVLSGGGSGGRGRLWCVPAACAEDGENNE